MSTLLLAALAVLVTHVLLAGAFLGIGLSARRALGPREHGFADLLRAFWVGFGVVLGFLMVWNALRPVDDVALALVLAAGLAGLLAARGGIRLGLRADPWRPGRGVVLAALATALWIAHLASGPDASWDDSLYHLQAVRWANEYAVVPGIANLHGPLAFNNASFLYGALLDGGPWTGGGFHLAASLLVQVTLLGAWLGFARLRSGSRRGADVFACSTFAPALYWVLGGRVSSYSTDLPAALVLLAGTGALVSWLGDARRDAREDAAAVVSIALLLAAVVCLKISLGVVAAVGTPLAWAVAWRRRTQGAQFLRAASLSLATVVAFAAAWIVRGVVQSGYPMFPLTVAPFDVDWRAPAEHGLAEVANIAYTEREFAWGLGWNWARRVTIGDPFAVLVPSFVAALAVFALALALRRRGRACLPAEVLALPPFAAALVPWFLVAPSTRYGAGLLWALAAASVSAAAVARGTLDAQRSRSSLAAALLLLGCALPLLQPCVDALREDRPLPASLRAALTVPPPAAGWIHGVAQADPLTTFTTNSGLVLNVPDQDPARAEPGDGLQHSRPWDAPLPTTPNPAPNLRLRVPGRLDRGFRVDGPWAMESFPYPWRSGFMEHWRKQRGD